MEKMRCLLKPGGFIAKVHNQVIITLQKSLLPSRFMADRNRFSGHTHLVVFRKSKAISRN